MKKKAKVPEGWSLLKNLKDGSLFRYSPKSTVKWKVNWKRGAMVEIESQSSNLTKIEGGNKKVYLES